MTRWQKQQAQENGDKMRVEVRTAGWEVGKESSWAVWSGPEAEGRAG